MRKKKEPATKPLKGLRVLVGRARHQAGALSSELHGLGAQVIEIPFIQISKPRSFKPLDKALKHLADYEWLILTSANGVEAMWERMEKLNATLPATNREGHEFTQPALSEHSESKGALTGKKKGPALAAEGGRLRIAAIGPATRKAIEQRGMEVDVVPKEYVAESVVRSLKAKVKGKRVLLVRAKVARDVIPNDLRKAGARVDVVEAYETVVPETSRRRLQSALNNPKRRPHVVIFTSSSTVRNFVELLGSHRRNLAGIRTASIGPVTSATLRELGLSVDIAAKEFTIPGLVEAIVRSVNKAM